MPRKVGYWLALGVAAACVVGAAWPGAASNPATLISRVGALVIVGTAAVLHWPVRRRFGPVGTTLTARIVRIAGFALVSALILVKAAVERHEFAQLAGRPALTGVWAGEIAFLIVISAYLTGLLAITARRPPASRAVVVIGIGAGVLLGLAVYVLRPLDNPAHFGSAWLAALFQIARVLAIPAVLGTAVAAVIIAARRSSRRDSKAQDSKARDSKARDTKAQQPTTRTRQGLAAGLCIGVTCALLVSVLGIATIAVAPRAASSIQWTIPGGNLPPSSLYRFEVDASHAVAGYLLILIIFPFLGAGLGAWGGLLAAGNKGLRPGGGGGGGTKPPRPQTPPSGGGLQLDGAPAFTAASLLSLPEWDPATGGARSQPAAPERAPATRLSAPTYRSPRPPREISCCAMTLRWISLVPSPTIISGASRK
jgi:hypothetical protein